MDMPAAWRKGRGRLIGSAQRGYVRSLERQSTGLGWGRREWGGDVRRENVGAGQGVLSMKVASSGMDGGGSRSGRGGMSGSEKPQRERAKGGDVRDLYDKSPDEPREQTIDTDLCLKSCQLDGLGLR